MSTTGSPNPDDGDSNISPNPFGFTELAGFTAEFFDLYEQGRPPCSLPLTPATAHSQSLFKEILAIAREIPPGLFERMIRVFSLDTAEGKALLQLVEALPRIQTRDQALQRVRETLGKGDWHTFLSTQTDAVNALLIALEIGKDFLLAPDNNPPDRFSAWWHHQGEAAILAASTLAVRKLGSQFVCAESLQQATERSQPLIAKGFSQSFDMLGEAALTHQDATDYYQHYLQAIEFCAQHNGPTFRVGGASVSIKLSALDPVYELRHWRSLETRLVPRLTKLLQQAIDQQVAITIDAEESWRLELSLRLLQRTLRELKGPLPKNLIGMAVQAYQKRAPLVLDWLARLADHYRTRFQIRLVKGAYWDTEIKAAEQLGLKQYPVFCTREETDACYLHCARLLVGQYRHQLGAQFATHNAMTLAQLLELRHNEATEDNCIEFQKLFGMGDAIYDGLLQLEPDARVRVYCPIGAQAHLLPYLVRRLLENGANTSFLNQFYRDDDPQALRQGMPIQAPPQNPCDVTKTHRAAPPMHLHSGRSGAALLNAVIAPPAQSMATSSCFDIEKRPPHAADYVPVQSPAAPSTIVGRWHPLPDTALPLLAEQLARPCSWSQTSLDHRQRVVHRLANALWQSRSALLALLVHEAGKTLTDACAELRELLAFCDYYPRQLRRLCRFAADIDQCNGESNHHGLQAKGTLACISPWNFPLAIFGGQIIAALITGNRVVAKPSSLTPLISHYFCELCYQSGVPRDALHLLLASGAQMQHVIGQNHFDAIAFTGATDTALGIAQALAQKGQGFPHLIAETGGINAMIVDDTALPEQVIADALTGAFNSAGQRCSATRLLLVPEHGFENYWEKIAAALDTLTLGHPAAPNTHLGPMISAQARESIRKHIKAALYDTHQAQACELPGYYQPPTLVFAPDWQTHATEVFGPVLHIAGYPAGEFKTCIDQINRLGYGLTGAIHSRLEAHREYARNQFHVGNLYINRNQIGAVPGSQPFGGARLSGSGAKAGGPFYLLNFVQEKTVTENLMACGGNLDIFGRPSGHG